MKIKLDTVLVLETGEYSSYTFHGPFKILKEFDQAKISKEFTSSWVPKYEWIKRPETDDFIAWLVTQRYIEPMENIVAWPLGDCMGFSPEIQKEPSPEKDPS